jgi:alginate O-acetyltransferase complex protein AlgI
VLFNSYAFILGFMPLTLLLFHGLRAAGLARSSIGLLTLLSLGFYGWWNPIYLLLIVPLIVAFEGFGVHLFSVLRPPRPTVGSRYRRRPC